jgi:UDP-glucose 4-epimerase
MKILVTGGAGYIGSACTAALIKEGHSVVVFDDLSSGQVGKLPPGVECVVGDITDSDALNAVFLTHHFDAVFHFAAKKAVGESEQNPALYFRTNVQGTHNVLAAMSKAHVPQLIFSSTAAVYDPLYTATPVTEETPLRPVSVYGTTKKMVEDMILAYARTGKIARYSILRYFNVAGDAGLDFREETAQNVFPIIARGLKSAVPFSIFGTDYDTKDGTCVRDYIHVRDLVAGHVAALEAGQSGIFNLGTGTGYTVRELVAAFNAQLPNPLIVVEAERRAGDAPQVVADATLARKVLGWEPQHTLPQMVADTLRVYRA